MRGRSVAFHSVACFEVCSILNMAPFNFSSSGDSDESSSSSSSSSASQQSGGEDMLNELVKGITGSFSGAATLSMPPMNEGAAVVCTSRLPSPAVVDLETPEVGMEGSRSNPVVCEEEIGKGAQAVVLGDAQVCNDYIQEEANQVTPNIFELGNVITTIVGEQLTGDRTYVEEANAEGRDGQSFPNENGEGTEEVDVVVPVVGMVFEDMCEVEAFYKNYANQMGFGVTRTQGSYTVDKVRRATTWRCDCYGDPDTNLKRKCRALAKDIDEGELKDRELRNPKRRVTKKCFCAAMIYASINEIGQWVIRKVVLDHKNHQPVPSNSKLVKEYRMQKLTGLTRRKILNQAEAGVPIPNIHSGMASERGGYENMPFNECDIRHVVNESRRLKMAGGDANALLAYFAKMQRDNGNFFYTHRVDSKGFITDILWVDARSSAAYEEFSDVVCFDTTYLTNQYQLPFANFVGVNHHGQSVLFGCALISKEDCETFEWVFKEWLGAMKGKAPGGILTDQAAAMRRPLEVVMPNTKHRWCIWHILKKLPYKFKSMKCYKKFKKELLAVIYNSLNEGSFEQGWNAVVVKYGLASDEWLGLLFAERHMWVPSFMTDHFWAGMRSTQRVESMNSYFDKFLTKHTMLCEFGEKYTAAIERRIAQEKEADEKAMKFRRNYSTGYAAERYFLRVYTSNKFRVLQRECEKLTYCMVQEESVVGENVFDYLMEDRVWVYPKKKGPAVLTDAYVYYSVMYNAETKEAVCDCKMFETQGIMCRHLIRLYEKLHIKDVPEIYVLRRWRKDVARKHASVRVAFHDLSRTEEVRRHDKHVWAFEHVSDIACKNDKLSNIFLSGMKRIQEELVAAVECTDKDGQGNSAPRSNGTTYASSSMPEGSSAFGLNSMSAGMMSQCGENAGGGLGYSPFLDGECSQPSVKDPPIPKKRGRPRGSRFKAISETGWKLRRCDNEETDDAEISTKSKGKGKSNGRSKGKKRLTAGSEETEDQLCNGDEKIESQKSKIPVKRRKVVTFNSVTGSQHEQIMDIEDDLLDRNFVVYDI